MTFSSQSSRYELFFATAAIAAHASSTAQSGFRQRDLRFLIELFSNWTESALPGHVLELQNTQVARFVSRLTEEGFARRMNRKGPPAYRLTRIGLIELLSRLVHQSYVWRRDEFFFLHYFVKNYRARIEALVAAEGRHFPHALRLELEDLLDAEALLKREQRAAALEVQKLEARMRDALATAQLIERRNQEGADTDATVAEIQRLYPYELNSQRPLTELIAWIPADARLWELSEGNKARVREIWQPAVELLRGYQKSLEALAGNSKQK